MKTIAEQLIESEAALAKAIADLEAANAATLAMAGERDTLSAQVKTLTEERTALAAAHGVALADAGGKLTAEQAAHAATQTALAEANKKLANPAYRMASAPGDASGAPEGGAPAESGVSLVAQMKAIIDPVKRAEFYHANMEAIKAELK